MNDFYELETVYDSAKSFYGKAHVICNDDGSKTLRSYDTNVMYFAHGEMSRAFDQPESNTTARHMREFARQCGLPRMSKAELTELPVRR